MPWQLRNAHRPRPGQSKRPIAEQLQSINVNDLRVPKDYSTKVMAGAGLRWPFLSCIRVSCAAAELTIPSQFRGREPKILMFRLKPIDTKIGIRFAFICQCGKPVIKVYWHNNTIACKRCCKARYASQVCDKHSRPILQAARIQSFLDNKLGLYQRTRARLERKFGHKLLIAQGKQGTRASKLLD
jgi:hypothetical protein